MTEGDTVDLLAMHAEQHFTEPPPRYSEASLVKALEEHGIGRPSTYATIISTLQDREYVEMDARRFIPTDIGKIVGRFLTEHFHRYVEYGFTAAMEDELDAVSRGEEEWTVPLDKFWKPFIDQVESIEKNVTREQVAQARELGKDAATGKPVTVRMGRFGPFVQIGTKDDEEKPRFAGLRPGQKMDTINLADAMDLFQLPRTLGVTADGETMVDQRRPLRAVYKIRQQVCLAERGRPVHGHPRARARSHPPQTGSGCEPPHPGFPGRRHPGVEWPLRALHHRQEKERQDPEGSRARSRCTLEECKALIAAAPERGGGRFGRFGRGKKGRGGSACGRCSGDRRGRQGRGKKKKAANGAAKAADGAGGQR